jgi:hypothetical protein
MQFTVEGDKPADVYVVDESYELPAAGESLRKARPGVCGGVAGRGRNDRLPAAEGPDGSVRAERINKLLSAEYVAVG